jgi:hypothetical protein
LFSDCNDGKQKKEQEEETEQGKDLNDKKKMERKPEWSLRAFSGTSGEEYCFDW